MMVFTRSAIKIDLLFTKVYFGVIIVWFLKCINIILGPKYSCVGLQLYAAEI